MQHMRAHLRTVTVGGANVDADGSFVKAHDDFAGPKIAFPRRLSATVAASAIVLVRGIAEA
ncbi:MAG: hypothetical protein ACI4SV_02715, partial [Duodenibacillus sp.]